MNLLDIKLAGLKSEQKKGLIAFMMAGYPDFTSGVDCACTLEDAGCDILEIGVPYADPIADGEVIEQAHFQGVARGMNMSRALEFMHAVREKCQIPLVLFSYFNLVYQRGMAGFTRELQEAGGSAAIIPDLPLDERPRFQQDTLDLIPMVAPTSDIQHIELADEYARSFIYCVSIAGVTGRRQQLPDLTRYLQRVRAHTIRPLAVGFGISHPEQITELRDYADAFVVGSLLVETMTKYAGEKALLQRQLRQAVSGLKKALN